MDNNLVPSSPTGNQTQQPNLVQPSIQQQQQPSQPPQPPKNNNKISKITVGAIAVFILSILTFAGAIGAYFYITNNESEKPVEKSTAAESQSATISANSSWYLPDSLLAKDKTKNLASQKIDISGWKTFTNEDFFYSLKHPEKYTVECYEENSMRCFIFLPENSSLYDDENEDSDEYEENQNLIVFYDAEYDLVINDEDQQEDQKLKSDLLKAAIEDKIPVEYFPPSSYMERVDNLKIGNLEARVFKSHGDVGYESELTKTLYIAQDNKKFWVTGALNNDGISEKIFDQIFSTFKFTDNKLSNYNLCQISTSCNRVQEGVNKTTSCTNNYINWAEESCP